jgi:hypothetical protein
MTHEGSCSAACDGRADGRVLAWRPRSLRTGSGLAPSWTSAFDGDDHSPLTQPPARPTDDDGGASRAAQKLLIALCWRADDG